jgi:hypothetical protein
VTASVSEDEIDVIPRSLEIVVLEDNSGFLFTFCFKMFKQSIEKIVSRELGQLDVPNGPLTSGQQH